MKKIYLFFILILFPAMMMAQVSGGQVVRKPNQGGKVQSASSSAKTQLSRSAILKCLIANMVYVEGGTFTMGEDGEEYDKLHKVTLSSYYIGKYEVTQEEWQAVMGNNPSRFKGAKRPVENVSWNDCQTFIRKLNSLTGKQFRLPTEAEWEYAAKGGNKSKGYKYSGSNSIGNVAWYLGNSGLKTHPVGQKAPNELGIYDMTGNVSECCSDWCGGYDSTHQTNPQGPPSGTYRMERGSGYNGDIGNDRWSDYCAVTHRGSTNMKQHCSWMGLRLVLSQ